MGISLLFCLSMFAHGDSGEDLVSRNWDAWKQRVAKSDACRIRWHVTQIIAGSKPDPKLKPLTGHLPENDSVLAKSQVEMSSQGGLIRLETKGETDSEWGMIPFHHVEILNEDGAFETSYGPLGPRKFDQIVKRQNRFIGNFGTVPIFLILGKGAKRSAFIEENLKLIDGDLMFGTFPCILLREEGERPREIVIDEEGRIHQVTQVLPEKRLTFRYTWKGEPGEMFPSSWELVSTDHQGNMSTAISAEITHSESAIQLDPTSFELKLIPGSLYIDDAAEGSADYLVLADGQLQPYKAIRRRPFDDLSAQVVGSRLYDPERVVEPKQGSWKKLIAVNVVIALVLLGIVFRSRMRERIAR